MPFSSFSFSFSFDDDDGEEGDDIGNHLVTSKQKRKDKQVRGGVSYRKFDDPFEGGGILRKNSFRKRPILKTNLSVFLYITASAKQGGG